MSRVNRPDTLFTELREIQRRLRILEGTGARTSVASLGVPASGGAALVPARPAEWPGTESPEWEALARTLVAPGTVRVVVESFVDTGTSGEVRVQGGEAWEVGGSRREVVVRAADEVTEIVVEARRTSGEGSVRVAAFALPG